ncbi:MAG: DUF1858 domain-containing protein [Lachnospiraceae bacterium]|nr:DUF1858 domain-containing protein [Lachnospiraceae bacterium]
MAEQTTADKILVTKDMIVGDILKMYPDAAYALMNCGMGCISCPAALGETLEQACYVHGLDSDEVAEYVNAELGLID